MSDTLRKRFERGETSIPDDPDLVEQLTSLRYSFTSAGQIQLESKESMSGRGLRSPDKGDALALAPGYDPILTFPLGSWGGYRQRPGHALTRA